MIEWIEWKRIHPHFQVHALEYMIILTLQTDLHIRSKAVPNIRVYTVQYTMSQTYNIHFEGTYTFTHIYTNTHNHTRTHTHTYLHICLEAP